MEELFKEICIYINKKKSVSSGRQFQEKTTLNMNSWNTKKKHTNSA